MSFYPVQWSLPLKHQDRLNHWMSSKENEREGSFSFLSFFLFSPPHSKSNIFYSQFTSHMILNLCKSFTWCRGHDSLCDGLAHPCNRSGRDPWHVGLNGPREGSGWYHCAKGRHADFDGHELTHVGLGRVNNRHGDHVVSQTVLGEWSW